MKGGPSRLVAFASLLLLASPGGAYQTPVVEPGGTYTDRVRVINFGSETRTIAARARLVGHEVFGSPRQSAVRGPWVEIPGERLGPGERRDHEVVLPVPGRLPTVLSVEVWQDFGLPWSYPTRGPSLLGEPAVVPAGRTAPGAERVPFRIVGGGKAAYDFEVWDEVLTRVARTAAEWDDLRAYLGIVSPDSWGLHPDGNDPPPRDGGWEAEFAAASPPDMTAGTLLALRTPDFEVCNLRQQKLWVRSVDRRPDGTLVCRYTYRTRYFPDNGLPCEAYLHPGWWLLVAIPRTDAPIEFERVP